MTRLPSHVPEITRGGRLFFTVGRSSLGRIHYGLSRSEKELTATMRRAFRGGWYDISVLDLATFMAAIGVEFEKRAASPLSRIDISDNGAFLIPAELTSSEPPPSEGLRIPAQAARRTKVEP
jgi:hypothetical protein